MSTSAMDVTPSMENATTNLNNIDQDFTTVLTTGLIIHVSFLIISAYILLCLVVYGVKAQRWDWKTDGGRLHIACVVTVALTFPRGFGILFLYLAPAIGALDNCEIIMDYSYGFGNVALMSIYIFLWIRQRTIYTNPYMRALTPTWLNIFSMIMLGYVIVMFLALIFTYTIPESYTSSPQGCIVDLSKNDISEWGMVVSDLLLAVVTIGQILMFLLFAFPMVRVKLAQRGIGHQSGHDPVIATLLRTTIGTFVVVVANIASVNIAMNCFSPVIFPMAAGEPMYDIGYIISYISLVATFDNYGQILTSCCRKIDTPAALERKRTVHTVATMSKDHRMTARTENNKLVQ